MDTSELIESRCRELISIASCAGLTVCTAESLTAGLVTSSIAAIPGASAVLKGGSVVYCDHVKHVVLDVSNDTLERHTAVSGECACEMARGALRLYGADVAVSLTGYAGPGVGERGELPGTVYIGMCLKGSSPRSELYCFSGDRNEVREKAAAMALERLLAACMELS